MKIIASLNIYGDSEMVSTTIAPCLEATRETPRASITAEQKQDHVHLIISANDVTAFRAVMNSVVQLLTVQEKMADIT